MGFGSWQLMDCHRELVQQDFLIFLVCGSAFFLNGVLVQSASRTCSSSQLVSSGLGALLTSLCSDTHCVRIQCAQQFNTRLTTLSASLQSPQHRPRWWFSLVCCGILLWLSLVWCVSLLWLVCCVSLLWFSLVSCGTLSWGLLFDTYIGFNRLLVL